MNWPPESWRDWVKWYVVLIVFSFCFGFGRAWGYDMAWSWFR